ncbi:MAG: glycosyltransferase family 4 protein [Candidatus Baldrarchaeia archaeon]
MLTTNLSDKKRVLFVMGFTCPYPGAGWRRVFNFAKYFTKKGHECYILSSVSPRSINSPKIVREKNIPIYNVIPSIMVNNPLLLFLNNILAFVASIPFFLVIKPHVVIISLPPARQFLSTFILSKVIKSKLVVDYRDEFEDYLVLYGKKWRRFYLLLKKVLSWLYRRSHLITPVTPAVAESLKQRGVLNVRVIHDGVDTSVFKPWNRNKVRSAIGLSKDVFQIVYLGNVYSPYRLDIVVEALRILKEKGKEGRNKYMLIIVGGGDIKRILDYASNIDVKEMVNYVGRFNNPIEIAKILSAADVGIIPYDDNPLWKKTLSTKLFEYCACALPVIAMVTKDSILASYIKENQIGFVVPPLDSKSLANSIESMYDEPRLRSIISSNALRFAEKYDKKKIAEELLSYVLPDE